VTSAAPTTAFDGTFTNSAGADAFWMTQDASGNVTEDPIVRNLYVVPPMGVYRLRLMRFSKPFELPRAAEYGGGTQTMLRLELRIVGGPGDGKKCTPMVSASIGQKAKLGQVIRAAIHRDLGAGEGFNLYSICKHLNPHDDANDFVATLKPSTQVDEQTGKPKHTNLVDGTIGEVSASGDDGWVE
jgi:hypothetical protein